VGRLGAVVAGTGFGCVTHVRALRAAGFEVRAIVGRDPVKTARWAIDKVSQPAHRRRTCLTW
jgi:ribosomal protein S11